MHTLAHSSVLWVGLIAGLVLLYFLPTMIGIIRKVESLGLLIFLNVPPTGGGWLAAMVMAFMLPHREPPLTYIPCRYLPQYRQAPRGNWQQQRARPGCDPGPCCPGVAVPLARGVLMQGGGQQVWDLPVTAGGTAHRLAVHRDAGLSILGL
jgi:hypothetical protein